MYKSLILSVSLVSLLSGCLGGNILGANDKFACKNADGGGVRCMKARDVYAATSSSDSLSMPISEEDEEKESKSTSDKSGAKTVSASSNVNINLPSLDKPLPMRTNAKVIRVMIFPWQDNNGDLHTGGYVFSEIEQRKWTLADEQIAKKHANQIRPLAAQPIPASSKNGAEYSLGAPAAPVTKQIEPLKKQVQ